MARYIRYLDKGEYQYASVKPIGDMSLLKIDAPDLVTAINGLIDGGIVIPSDPEEIQKIKDDLSNLTTTVKDTSDLLGEVQAQVIDYKAIQDGLVAKEAELRAELDTATADLGLTKSDLETTKDNLAQAQLDLGNKVNSLQYEEEYAQIEQSLRDKADSANVQTIVEGINQDLADQLIEVGTIKTNILTLGEKVDQQRTDLTGDLDSTKAEIKITTDGIFQTVTNLSSTVSGQDTRISSAETAIEQHETSINLKANATEVYNKSSIDDALGKKVDTTTYSDKMSSIDISISGISQTVSSQETVIDNLSGTVTSHTSQISTIDQKADGIALRVSETEGDISGLTGRVSTAESQIITNKNSIELKASQSSVDSLDGRVTSAEGQLTVQAGQIATKVSLTDYESAVGVKKWIATKYDLILGSSDIIPTFDHIKGKAVSAVKEYVDDSILDAFTDSNFMAHYFTNVYLDTAKTITLNVSNDDGASIFLNGASIYGRGSNANPLAVYVAFREGWNTIEVLHYDTTGEEQVSLGLKISDQVTKMTSVIGVGDKNETRLTQAESSIIQNADSIALKADSTVTTDLGNRVTATEGQLTVQAGEIASKVSQTEFDGYSNRLTTAESSIVQLADSISSKVSKTEFDTLNGKYTEQQSQIIQLSDSIESKVEQSSFDSLNNKYTEQQSQIIQLSDSITSKVSQSTFDELSQNVSDHSTQIIQTATDISAVASRATSLEGRVTTAEAGILTNADQIALKATQSSMDELTGRVSTAEGQLTVQAGEIASKVTQSQVDTAISDDKKFIDTRDENEEPNYYWTSYPRQKVEEFKNRTVLGVTGTASYGGLTTIVPYSDISGGAITQQFVSSDGVFDRRSTSLSAWSDWVKSEDTAGSQKKIDEFNASIVEPIVTRVSTAESTIVQHADSIALKASQSSVDTLTGRVTGAEGSITALAGEVALKASQTTVDSLTGRVGTAEASIIAQAGQIASKVSQSSFDEVEGRVDYAESSIIQQAGLISSKVEKDGIISSINQSAEGIKINAQRLDITGLVTFESMDWTIQDRFTEIEDTSKYVYDRTVLSGDVGNYIINPSFEGGRTTGYTNVSSVYSQDAIVPPLAPSTYVGCQTTRINYADGYFPVAEGEVFIVEGWVASKDSPRSFGLGLELSTSFSNQEVVNGYVWSNNTWQSYKRVYTIPAGVVKARFISVIQATDNIGNWFFTNVRVTKMVGDDVIANSDKWNSADNFVNTWKTPNKTTINGANIETGSISASMIKTNELIVGQNVQMGSGAVIDWNNVSSKPSLLYSGDSRLTKIDANGIYTGAVVADMITGGTMRAGTIDIDTNATVGVELNIGAHFQSSSVKSLNFNKNGGGAGLQFYPQYDLMNIEALNTISFTTGQVDFKNADILNFNGVARFG